MISIRVWDTKNHTRVDKSESIVDGVSIFYTKCGYEVLIDLKTRRFDINGYGSCSGFDEEPPTESITFEMENGIWHTVEWEVPDKYKCADLRLNRLSDVNKDQVIVYYVDWDYLQSSGNKVGEYRCPSNNLWRTFNTIFDIY